MSKSLKQSEDEKKMIIKILIPVSVLFAAGAFAGGICLGIEIAD